MSFFTVFKTYKSLILTAGFAMFAMFFGSGNLVFPIKVGVDATNAFALPALGLLITGVLVPFLGLVGILYVGGNVHHFFEKLGKPIAFTLILLMLCLLGPFAVVPRCTIVAYGGVSLILPTLSMALFNGLFLSATFLLALKKNQIINIVGTYLTPLLLGGILLLIVFGILNGGSHNTIAPEILPPVALLKIGLEEGYQTMDLLAAFFFSASTVAFIAKKLKSSKDKKHLEKVALLSCTLGAMLLGGIYGGLVKLGLIYKEHLMGLNPEHYVVGIARHSLGAFSESLSALIITFACLTTAVVLISLFTDFIESNILKSSLIKHHFKIQISRSVLLLLSSCVAYLFSLMGFESLAKGIISILIFVYPALISYSISMILNLKNQYFSRFPKLPTLCFWSALALTGIKSLI